MFRFSQIAAVLCLVLLLGTVVATRAAAAAPPGAAPFRGDGIAVFAGFDGARAIFIGEGQGSQLGAFTSETRDLGSANGRRHRGETVVTTARGDQLVLTYDVRLTEPGVWVGPFSIEGGTGRFEHATGGGTFTVGLIEDGVVSTAYDGAISY